MKRILEGELDVYGLFLEGNIDEISVCITKIMNNFIENIELLFSDSCLVNLHKNLEELYVEIDSSSDEFYALYNTNENRITIYGKLLEEALYHELFHLSSRLPGSNKQCGGCGFSRYEDDKSFGDGITEGYTDLLTHRFFESNIYYELEHRISYLLEKIIGRGKMESLYMNGDIDSLISILGDGGFEFICDVDRLFMNHNDYDLLEKIGKYLLQLCIDKKKQLYEFINLLDQFGILGITDSLELLKDNGIYDDYKKGRF